MESEFQVFKPTTASTIPNGYRRTEFAFVGEVNIEVQNRPRASNLVFEAFGRPNDLCERVVLGKLVTESRFRVEFRRT